MIGTLISFLTICASTGLSIFFLSKIIKYVVLFSKVAFALLGAAVLNHFYTIVETSVILNFLVMLLPMLGLCLLVNLLPRTNFAITFLLNNLIITTIGTAVSGNLLSNINTSPQVNQYLLLGIYLVGAVVSFWVLLNQVKVKKDLPLVIFRGFDRLLGSVINTASLFYIILQTVNFPDNIPLLIIAVCVSVILFYLADLLLFKRISPLATGRKMPSEIRYILKKDWTKSKIFNFSGDFGSWDISSGDRDASNWAYEDQQRRNRELEDSYWAAKEAQDAYDYQRQQTESANRYYDENY